MKQYGDNKEHTGKRDMVMSSLHRRFGGYIFVTDIDQIELNKIFKPIALNEIKIGLSTKVSVWQQSAYRGIADACNIPAFTIKRNEDADEFVIEPLNGYADAFTGKVFAQEFKTDQYYWEYENGERSGVRCSLLCLHAFYCAQHGLIISQADISTEDMAYLKSKNRCINLIKEDVLDVDSLFV